MALTINVKKSIRVIKELNFKDQSLDPEKSRTMDGNYMRIDVLDPTYIEFTTKKINYTDEDIKNNYKKEKIEDILAWPTIREFMKKQIINVAIGVPLDKEPTKTKGSRSKDVGVLSLGEEPTEE